MTAGSLPGQLGLRPPLRLSGTSVVFLTVSGLSRRQPLLLLPGCSGVAPCAIAGHDVSLHLTRGQAARAKSPSALLWVPRLTSLRNSGRTSGFRSPRRNRSAPCQGSTHLNVAVGGQTMVSVPRRFTRRSSGVDQRPWPGGHLDRRHAGRSSGVCHSASGPGRGPPRAWPDPHGSTARAGSG